LFDAQAHIVKFGEAIAFGRYEAIEHGPIQGPWRAAHGGASVYDIEELSPVSAIPHLALSSPWADVQAIGCRKLNLGSTESSESSVLPAKRNAADCKSL
jgi:hypothetical protein